MVELKTTDEVVRHTPGPWTVECVVGNDPHDICGPDRPGEGSPNLLASVAYDFDDPLPHLSLEEANANARLIAAAPDMYKICRELLDWVHGKRPGRCVTDDMTQRLSAALAKAEGR